MTRFTVNGVPKCCPTHLSECNEQQVAFIMAYQLGLEMYKSDRERVLAKIALFRHLTGVTDKVIKKLTKQQLETVLNMTRWACEAKVENRPFETFTLGRVRYILPAEKFADTTAIELADANMAMLAMLREENPDENAIYRLLAVLCREERGDIETFRKSKDWNGDTRQEYNSLLVSQRAELFKKQISPGIARAVLMFFEKMNREFWEANDILLGETEDEPLFQNGEGQIKILMDIAEMQAFGDFDKVCGTNVHTVYFNLRAKQLEAQQRQNQKDDEPS